MNSAQTLRGIAIFFSARWPTEKVVLEGKLGKKLFAYRLASDSMIELMLKTVAADEIEGKDTYVN